MSIRHGWWMAVLLVLPLTARAAGFNVVAGVSTTTHHDTTPVVFASVFGEGTTFLGFPVEPIGTVGWIKDRDIRAFDLNHTVFIAGGGGRILTPGRHWFFGVQVGATSAETDALSSRFEFIDSAGWQSGHLTIMIRHISNARWIGRGRNLGETMLLAGIRW